MLSATNPRSTTCLVHHEVVVVKSETSHRSVRLEITCSGYPERQFFGLRPQLRVLAVVDIGARFETRRRSVLGAPGVAALPWARLHQHRCLGSLHIAGSSAGSLDAERRQTSALGILGSFCDLEGAAPSALPAQPAAPRPAAETRMDPTCDVRHATPPSSQRSPLAARRPRRSLPGSAPSAAGCATDGGCSVVVLADTAWRITVVVGKSKQSFDPDRAECTQGFRYTLEGGLTEHGIRR
jgi:hypothetical protein